MRTTITVIALSMLFGGCSTEGKFRTQNIVGGPCGDVDGYTYTNINYGDGHLSVRTRTEIHPNSEWRFYLKPNKRRGGVAVFGDSTVTISNKTAGEMVMKPDKTGLQPYVVPGPPPANGNWLSASGSYRSTPLSKGNNKYIVACVPADALNGQDWYYEVDVTNIGTVDPRGRIER